jgi:hypothetical protein
MITAENRGGLPEKEEMIMSKVLSIVGYLLLVTVVISGFALPPQAQGQAAVPHVHAAVVGCYE